MPDVSFSEGHQTIDVVEFHVGRQKSYSALILDTEKESIKSPEKTASYVRLQFSTPCIQICTRDRVCCYKHGNHGPIGAQRSLTQVT